MIPEFDAWQIQWTDPVTQTYLSMIGRRDGDDIVQLGKNAEGNLIRWSSREITAGSFLWRGEVSADRGATWRLDVEFLARRMLRRAHDRADRQRHPGALSRVRHATWARAVSPGASVA